MPEGEMCLKGYSSLSREYDVTSFPSFQMLSQAMFLPGQILLYDELVVVDPAPPDPELDPEPRLRDSRCRGGSAVRPPRASPSPTAALPAPGEGRSEKASLTSPDR